MTVTLAPDHAVPELTLSGLDARALLRRAAVPALVACAALAAVLLGGGRVHALAEEVRRGFGVSPGWAGIGAVLECLSLAGYAALLSLVAGRATARIGARESAQITLAGAAATRVLPTAGAGGLALSLWALRRAGLRAHAATRTLLVFLVVLYSVFLSSIVLAGGVLALGLTRSHGPAELSAIPAGAALLGIALCLALAFRRRRQSAAGDRAAAADAEQRADIKDGARLLGTAVGEAWRVARSGDPRIAGALAYWAFDAGVLWAMLHAFGAAPAAAVVALAYFVGQAANTLPIPGSVSGGVAGVLIAFGVPAAVALPSVLAYRAVAVWLPSPAALAALPALRATIARWSREDAVAS